MGVCPKDGGTKVLKRNFRTVLVACLLVGLFSINAIACTSVMITPGATVDGSAVVSHSNDCGSCGWQIDKVPAKDWAPGSMYEILTLPQYTDGYQRWENCLEPTGKFIPQVAHTYSYIWGHFGYLNENQVALGETTTGGRGQNVNANGFFEITHLTVLAMERAKTAREAIQIMGDLASKYGYYDSSEQLSVADPNEVWMFEICGPGPLWEQGDEGPGAYWVAQRVPDGNAAFCANAAVVDTIDWNNKDYFMYGNKDALLTYAKDRGWWDPSREFSWRYDMCNAHSKDAYSARRVWECFRLVAPKLHASLIETNLPFSVPVEKKLTMSDIFAIHRDHYEGTKYDASYELISGPFNNPRRPEGTLRADGQSFTWQRLISSVRTEHVTLCQVRKGLPNDIGGVLWYAANTADTSCFVPFYFGMNNITSIINTDSGSHWEFRLDSLWWAIASVNTVADLRWSLMIPRINQYQAKYETSVVNTQSAIDKAALELWNKDPKLAKEFLTNYCNNNATIVRDAWWELLYLLIQENSMGKVYDTDTKKITNPIYSETWVREMLKVTSGADLRI